MTFLKQDKEQKMLIGLEHIIVKLKTWLVALFQEMLQFRRRIFEKTFCVIQGRSLGSILAFEQNS